MPTRRKACQLLLGGLFAIILFSNEVAAKKISISPLHLTSSNDKHRFSAVFDLTNSTKRHQKLAALVVFRNEKVKWWRGVSLPPLEPSSKQRFSLAFHTRLMLSMDFDSIYVLIYDQSYKTFIDSSVKHGIIRSNIVYNGDVKLKLSSESNQTLSKTFKLGPRADVAKAMRNSNRSNASVNYFNDSHRTAAIGEYFSQKAKNEGFRGFINKETVQPSSEFSKVQPKVINVNQVFAQYFTIEPDPRLMYQKSRSSIEPDFINVSISSPVQLDIAEQEKIASLYIREGQSEKAIVFLSDQLSLAPDKVDTYVSLSNVYLANGDKTSALEVLNASLSNISFSKRMALNQALTEKSKESSTRLEVEEAGFLATQFSAIAKSLLEDKKYSEALQAFTSLQSLKPDFPDIREKIQFCRGKLKEIRLKQMMASLKSKIAEKPPILKPNSTLEQQTATSVTTDVQPQESVVVQTNKTPDEKKAEEAPTDELTEEAVSEILISRLENPEKTEKKENDTDKLVSYFLNKGEKDKAVFFLNEQIENDPTNAKAVLQRVELFHEERKDLEAAALMANSLESLSTESRAMIASELQDDTKTEKQLTDGSKLAKAYQHQAEVYFEANDCKNAHVLYTNLLNLVPDYPGLELNIATCEEALGLNASLDLKETTKAVLTADAVSTEGQVILGGIPMNSTVLLFNKDELVELTEVEEPLVKFRLPPGDYSLFIEAYGFDDYQKQLTVTAQTVLNDSITLIASEEVTSELPKTIAKAATNIHQTLNKYQTRMNQNGW